MSVQETSAPVGQEPTEQSAPRALGSWETARQVRSLVIGMGPEVPPVPVDTLLELSAALNLSELRVALMAAGNPPSHRLVTSLGLAELLAVEAAVEVPGDEPPLYSMANFWRVYVDGLEVGREEQLLAACGQLPYVTYAYRAPRFGPPAVNPGDDPLSPGQEYLDPAPLGVDAEHAWSCATGDGSNVRFSLVDLEWQAAHPDLAATTIHHVHGLNGHFADLDHGTRSLGVVMGNDNTVGIIGMAPNPKRVAVASYATLSGGGSVLWDPASAILAAAAPQLGGDVLLVEVQMFTDTGLALPVELAPAEYNAIRLTSLRHVIVVEPAGNGGFGLDLYSPAPGQFPLWRNPGNLVFQESYAIMVAAAERRPNDRWVDCCTTNVGTRVDCFASGTGILTTGHLPVPSYPADFCCTSAASAVVAGATVLVQSIYRDAVAGGPQPPFLRPKEMRALLSDPTLGTPPFGVAMIGVMPDIKAILAHLGISC